MKKLLIGIAFISLIGLSGGNPEDTKKKAKEIENNIQPYLIEEDQNEETEEQLEYQTIDPVSDNIETVPENTRCVESKNLSDIDDKSHNEKQMSNSNTDSSDYSEDIKKENTVTKSNEAFNTNESQTVISNGSSNSSNAVNSDSNNVLINSSNENSSTKLEKIKYFWAKCGCGKYVECTTSSQDAINELIFLGHGNGNNGLSDNSNCYHYNYGGYEK